MIYIKIIIEVGRGIRNDMVYEGNFNELKELYKSQMNENIHSQKCGFTWSR